MKIKIQDHEYEVPDGIISDLRAVLDKWENKAKQQPELEQKSPFERGKIYDTYYYINPSGDVKEDKDVGHLVDEERFAAANYCSDKALMEQRDLHETLNRLLWRFSEEHGGDAPWDGKPDHWLILRRIYNDGLYVYNWAGAKFQGIVYFRDKETAQAAIREIVEPFMAAHPEFVW